MGFPLRLLLALLATAAVPSPQEIERPVARSTRVSVPPRIDGHLDDEAWKLATPIGELVQIEPRLHEPPSEASDIRFVHDADHLYMMIRCYDREPDRIVSTTRERDAFLDVDDRVEMVFDTFHDHRNAFFFQINAGGSKGDALLTNNGANFNKPWDGIWDAAARIDELGWCAELALPFKTLNFGPNDSWGFNIERTIGRKREQDRWANGSRDFRLFNIYRAGDLTGLTDLRQGIGLDVVPFYVSHWRNERENGNKSLLGEPGFDLFYKIIPSLTFSLTVNTDFAETEVDTRQINLTRFPLFFPERRDFFLQDAGVFEFGFNNGGGGGDRSLIPFFSRRIGLRDGAEVPILGGAKITGRAGDYGIGFLDVQTDATEDVEGQNLFVGRLTKNVGAQSTVGGLVTHGNPSGDGQNTVVGLDATHRASILGGGRDLIATAFFLRSESEDVSGDQSAYGLQLTAPGDLMGWSLAASEIQDHFEADLGFVPRPGIRTYKGAFEYQPRPDLESVRQLEFSVVSEVITDTDGDLETWTTTFQPLGLFFESGEALALKVDQIHDELIDDFEIRPGITIAAGEYDFTRARLGLDTAAKRPLSASLGLEGGDFYDGERTSWSASLLWQPGPLFQGQCSYSWNDVSLAAGDFETQLAQLRANFSFTAELSWNNYLQWDNEADTIGVQSRLRWIPVPQQEVFLVFNETLESDSSSSAPQFEELSFKITYAVRF